ncbi:hypothetical protein BP6252_02834 [Coleophoma cylindrospora]|uniref:RRM domain-containing protein n=1 Tax=Coleophoma cylindrospora TaxID=1849047 RepID=A0A3D8SGG8_9HELO|nr:hypothetical protein BP6252_02834 [Coleophoma cylindrospora]
MSYPPPPGLNSNNRTSSSHPSLPARPPTSSVPPSSSFKPAFAAQPSYSSAGNAGGYGGGSFQGFAPRSVAPPQPAYQPYQQAAPAYPQQSYSSYEAPQQEYGAPQIRNPFPLPGQEGAGRGRFEEDAEMAAQIAQWQSAYAGKDESASRGYQGAAPRYNATSSTGQATSANAAPLGRSEQTNMSSHAVASAADGDTGVATVVSGKDGKEKTVVRTGGGTQWTDSSLLEWDPAHFRLFVGNLAGEVSDESLHKAFARWPSVQKARVIRDKRTMKSKGYGFVSFSDGDEFFQAARDMQGKYIGSHPVLLRRSTTEIKAVTPKDNKKGKNKGKHGKGGGRGNDQKDRTGAGVQKAGSKTKGGLRVLG